MKKLVAIILSLSVIISTFVIQADAAEDYLTETINGSDFVYYIDNGGAVIARGEGFVPERIGGYPVNKIDEYAYIGSWEPDEYESEPEDHSRKWIIPDSVTEIGDGAFEDNIDIKEIIIPASVIKIGKCAFKNCLFLEVASLSEGIQRIDDEAFSNCKKLKSITIPSNMSYLGSNTFENDEKLQSVVIKDGLTSIEAGTFLNCSNLKNVEFSNDLRSIGWQAFSGCKSLDNVRFPKELHYIGDEAFINCQSLENLILSKDILFFGRRAFYNCDSLTKIDFTSDGVVFFPLPYVGVECFGCFSRKVSKKPTLYMNDIIPPLLTRAIKDKLESCVVLTFRNSAATGCMNVGQRIKLNIPDAEITDYVFESDKSVIIDKDGYICALNDTDELDRYISIKTNNKDANYRLFIIVTGSPCLKAKKANGNYAKISKITIKKGKTADLKLTGKVSSIPNKYTSTKYAKITSKKNASTIKIRGIKKGSSTLKIKVNGVYTIKLRVKVV